MSSQSTPAFRIVYPDPAMTNAAWRKEYGRPTVENLAKYVAKFNESLQPGGCNAHVAEDMPNGLTGVVKIVRQSDNKVVANYMA